MFLNKVKLAITYFATISILFIIIVAANNGETINSTSIPGTNVQSDGEWKAPAYADKLLNRLTDLVEASKKGKEIFDAQCVICHGTTGKGDGAAGMGLTPRPANLTSEKVQSQSDGAIYWKITTGNPPMASYKGAFSKKQRWQLVTYIRNLSKK